MFTFSRCFARPNYTNRVYPKFKNLNLFRFQPHAHTYTRARALSVCHKAKDDQQLQGFWSDRSVWRRAAGNTLRCLGGCSLGDFGALFYLQYYSSFSPSPITSMLIAMAAGISTSVMVETVWLKRKEKFESWRDALYTATTMSMISMLTMELSENLVDYFLTSGFTLAMSDPLFWAALVPSLTVGFLTPLPYNYHRLKKYGKACH